MSGMNRQVVQAIAVREGKWWEINLPGIGTRTAARKLADVAHMATEAAAVWLDVEPDTLDVKISIEVPEGIHDDWAQARVKAEHARTEEAEAAALSRAVVHRLRTDGYTYAEAAQVLGISVQRVHQLAS